MSVIRLLHLAACFAFVTMAASAPSALLAQFPYLPPETIGNPKYEWRPELGGYRDLSTKLVWGYSLTTTVNSSYSYTYASTTAVANYGPQFALTADSWLAQADRYEATAATQTDPARALLYLQKAQEYRNSAACAYLSASTISSYGNWRLPTLAEYQSAYSKGLFSQGAGKFNMDQSPAVGLQLGYGGLHWTSNLSADKKKATAFNITDGKNMQATVGSSIRLILVRSAP